MSEHQIKLALLREYEGVLKAKTMYDELVREFSGLSQEALRFCERNDSPFREREKLERILKKAFQLVEYRTRSSDEEVPEP